MGKLKSIASYCRHANVEVKASAAYTACNIIQKGFSFITMPLFTRLLTTAQYGQVTVYLSWETILSVFISLYLAYGSFNTAMIKFRDDREGYMAAVNGICTLDALLFLAVYYPLRNGWGRVFGLPPALIIVMAVSIVANNAMQCWFAKCRFEFRYWPVVTVTLLTTVLSLTLQIVLVNMADEKGYARIIGAAAITIVFGGSIYFYSCIHAGRMFRKRYWSYALGFNIPLIPYYLSQMVYTHSDRIMISHMLGSSQAAIYSVAYNLAMFLSFVLQAVNSSYMPWIYSRMGDGQEREKNKAVSAGIAAFMALLLLAVISFAPEIIGILATGAYAGAEFAVPPVAVTVLLMFYAQLFINIEFYFEEKKYLVYGTILSAVLNVCLNYLLLPLFGYVAAAYTTLLSYMVLAGIHFFLYRHTLQKHGMEDNLYEYPLLGKILAAFVLLAFLMMWLYRYMLVRIVLACAVAAGCVWQRQAFASSFMAVLGRSYDKDE